MPECTQPIAPERFPIKLSDDTVLRLPMQTAVWKRGSWSTPGLVRGCANLAVRRAVIAIHGSHHAIRAQEYLRRATRAAEIAEKQAETLVICPDLVAKNWIEPVPSSELDIRLEPSLLFWDGGMFTGGLSAVGYNGMGYPNRLGRVSVLEVLNQILHYLVRSGDYPNLSSVVLVGQSGGGNTVARYAALGLYDPKEYPKPGSQTTRTVVLPPPGSCIEVRYVPMSATFLHLSAERFVPAGSLSPGTEFLSESDLGNIEFEVPSERTLRWALNLANVPITRSTLENLRDNYNNYQNGLAGFNDSLDHYMVSIGSEAARKNLSKRHVTFIAGSLDDLAADGWPASYLGGVNAAHRALLYKKHLEKVGLWDNSLHAVRIVSGVGHNGERLMQSASGLEAIFPPLPSCLELSPQEALGQIGRLVEDLLHRIPIDDIVTSDGPPPMDGPPPTQSVNQLPNHASDSTKSLI